MYESRQQPLLSHARFLRRLAQHVIAGLVLLLGSLLMGMLGYSYFEALPWRDGFLNSAMLLGGMGPVNPPLSDEGKVFAGVYALYAGLVFILAAGVMVAPVWHRLLHKFHWDDAEK